MPEQDGKCNIIIYLCHAVSLIMPCIKHSVSIFTYVSIT